ncbi:hypothetical protein [Aliidiomarina quisquiliarum]|uniref:hypothetical protein n=1 Tax=Aliidiomarina quisquiliarum TaxID=2938947 RepID=UPI00208F3C89|nr:hypothetical protein [Aliidiomarina quisquiliarum]MCO4320184.1 hypothetical protein [Aliidiomarina quisquiliarum]
MTLLNTISPAQAYVSQEHIDQRRTYLNAPKVVDTSLVPRQDSSEAALAAAVQERARLGYDQPADSEQRAVDHYQAIATYLQRDKLQQMVGIDVYA